MAEILVYQESPAPWQILRKSLEQRHHIHFTSSLSHAEMLLKDISLDLIIVRVHLEQPDVFTVIKTLRKMSVCTELPIICFCGKRNDVARQLDTVLEKATKAAGADGYLCIDKFCVSEQLDLEALRESVESFIKTN